ncbi:MAG: CHAT domain-containing protein [Salinivirgaceae bacterium]
MKISFLHIICFAALFLVGFQAQAQTPNIHYRNYRTIPADSVWVPIYQSIHSRNTEEADSLFQALSSNFWEDEAYEHYLFLHTEYSYWLRLAGGKSQPSADLLGKALVKVADKVPEKSFDVLFAQYYMVLHSASVEDKLKWVGQFTNNYEQLFPDNKLVNFSTTVHMIGGTASFYADDIQRTWYHWDYCRSHLNKIPDPLWFLRKVGSSVKMSQPETALLLLEYVYDRLMTMPDKWHKKFTITGNYLVQLMRMNRVDDAIEVGEKGLEYFYSHLEDIKKGIRPHAVIHLALIDAYLEKGRYTDAFEIMQRTYDDMEMFSYKGQTKSALLSKKRQYFAGMEMTDSALAYLNQAHKINLKAKTDPEYIAYNFMDNTLQNDFRQFGENYMQKKQYNKAISHFKKSLRAANLKHFEHINDTTYLIPPDEFRGLNTEATMRVVARLLEAMQALYKKSSDEKVLQEMLMYTNYGNNILKEQFKSLADEQLILTTSEFMKNNNAYAIFACNKLAAEHPNYIDSAFLYADMPRSFSLSYLKQLKHRNVSSKEDSLMTTISKLSIELANRNPSDTSLSEDYVNTIMDLLRAKMLLGELIDFESKKIYEEPDINEIKNNLNENDAVIANFITDTVVYSICYTNDNQKIHRETVADIEAKVRKLKRKLKTGGYTRSNGRELYEILIAPFQEELKNVTQLNILADELLSEVPFEVLTDANQNFLVQKFATRYYFSAKKMTKRKLQQPQSLLAVAPGFIKNDEFLLENVTRSMIDTSEIFRSHPEVSTLAPLKFALEEVKSINKLCKKSNMETWILENNDATELNFTQKVKEKDIIHIATHGISGKEYESGLFFSYDKQNNDDGFLHLPELYRLDLDANLIVLSACKTATGEIKKGEGVLALPRGFIYAGVPNIVASLWKVHDKHTKYLMERFYFHMLHNQNTYAEALQKAKLDALNKKHMPLDWSGFVLISE